MQYLKVYHEWISLGIPTFYAERRSFTQNTAALYTTRSGYRSLTSWPIPTSFWNRLQNHFVHLFFLWFYSVFSFFPDPFSLSYSSFNLILLISACSRFSFSVPVPRLLPHMKASNLGLTLLRCILAFPFPRLSAFWSLPAFKLPWLLTDPASAETLSALSFQRLPAMKTASAFHALSSFGRWYTAFFMRCCPNTLPIETIVLFLRCSFLEFHSGRIVFLSDLTCISNGVSVSKSTAFAFLFIKM